MTKMEANQAQARFSELLALVEGQERVVIVEKGQIIAAVISYADLKRLEALEQAEALKLEALQQAEALELARDITDFQVAITKSNNESYSVEEVINEYNKLHGTGFTVKNILND